MMKQPVPQQKKKVQKKATLKKEPPQAQPKDSIIPPSSEKGFLQDLPPVGRGKMGGMRFQDQEGISQ